MRRSSEQNEKKNEQKFLFTNFLILFLFGRSSWDPPLLFYLILFFSLFYSSCFSCTCCFSQSLVQLKYANVLRRKNKLQREKRIGAKIPHLCCVKILVRFALRKSIRCDNNNDISNTIAETNMPIKIGHKHSFSIRIATMCDSRIFDTVKCFF